MSGDSQQLLRSLEQQGIVGMAQGQPLDQAPDAAQDSPRLQAIPGVSKMTEGKYKNNPTMNMQEIYLRDKGYVKWIREHIGGHSAMSMRMLKAYIQARDVNKKERLGMQPVDPMAATPGI